MNVTILVLFWIILGLVVLFVALSGGPKGVGRQFSLDTRRGRKLIYTGSGVIFVALVAAVPAVVIAAVEDRDDIPAAGVFGLTEQDKRGRVLFGERCSTCHTLKAANAVGLVAPNLDELRPPKDLVLLTIRNGVSRGNGQMGANLVGGSDAEAVAAFVAKAVGQA